MKTKMISACKDYTDTQMRKTLERRFEEYKRDWQHKNELAKGSFIPQVELYQSEVIFLIHCIKHALKVQCKATRLELESLIGLLEAKQIAFQHADTVQKIETRFLTLTHENQLDTILFVFESSYYEYEEKGQISMFSNKETYARNKNVFGSAF